MLSFMNNCNTGEFCQDVSCDLCFSWNASFIIANMNSNHCVLSCLKFIQLSQFRSLSHAPSCRIQAKRTIIPIAAARIEVLVLKEPIKFQLNQLELKEVHYLLISSRTKSYEAIFPIRPTRIGNNFLPVELDNS